MGNIARREFVRAAAAAGLVAAGGVVSPLIGFGRARAQTPSASDWPNRPVRFVVPLAAGGGLDFMARVAADYLSRSLGQQVVIENRTGGGGTIAFETVAKSPPDGYSVLVTNDNIVSAPHILKLTMDYAKDLVPVIHLARQTLAAHPTLGVSSVAELIQAVKQRPGQGCATSGAGSNQHVLLEWFVQMSGAKLDHVPYRGAGQAINDLIAGHVKIAFLGPTSLIPHYRAGNVRLLAQSSAARAPTLPEIPTLEDAGYKGLVLEAWYAAFVPPGTPAALVARLNAEMAKAIADPGLRENFTKGAVEPMGGTAEELGKLARADSEKYAKLVKELNVR